MFIFLSLFLAPDNLFIYFVGQRLIEHAGRCVRTCRMDGDRDTDEEPLGEAQLPPGSRKQQKSERSSRGFLPCRWEELKNRASAPSSASSQELIRTRRSAA